MDLSPRTLMRLVQEAAPDSRGAEIYAEVWSGRSMTAARGRVTSHEPKVGATVVARVWSGDGRCGEAVGSDLGEAEVLLARAREASAFGSPHPTAGPIAPSPARTRGIAVDDRRHATLTDEDREDVVRTADREARSERRLDVGEAVYEEARTHRAIANSRGLAVDEHHTVYRSRLRASLDVPEGVLALSERADARSFSSIASFPIGQSLADRAAALAGPLGAAPSGPVRVVFPPPVTAAVFRRIATVFGWEDPGASFLGLGPLHRKIHLIDDGSHPGGLRSRTFDDRGIPPVPVVLVREGRLEGRLRDVDDAFGGDERPTGHRFGTRLETSNLLLRQGTRSVIALLSERDEVAALVIDHIEHLDEGFDLRSGLVRFVVSGQWRHGTRLVGAFRRVVLEGNLGHAFGRLLDVSSDTDRIGAIDAPALVFDGLIAVS